MTLEEAWELISDNIATDCGPRDEGWTSTELQEATDMFHRLYSPHLATENLWKETK